MDSSSGFYLWSYSRLITEGRGCELQLFHHGDINGGSSLNPHTICVALTGHGATAQYVELQCDESFTVKTFRAPPIANIVKEAGSLQTFNALAATQTDTEVIIKSVNIIPQFLAGAFMSCEKRDPATITFNFMSTVGVRDAGLALAPPTSDLSITHCTYTLQFCWSALNKKLTPVVYFKADSSFSIIWGEDLHS
jgi:hypothetical protein